MTEPIDIGTTIREAQETKWKANRAKVAFLQAIPWILTSWDHAIGRTVEHVIPLDQNPPCVILLFSDGSMAVTTPLISEPQTLTKGLAAVRDRLEPRHPDTFAAYDQLDRQDKEAGRRARLFNILGAIQNNLEQIPELKDHLRALVQEWETQK